MTKFNDLSKEEQGKFFNYLKIQFDNPIFQSPERVDLEQDENSDFHSIFFNNN
jgi:hypothetical protein